MATRGAGIAETKKDRHCTGISQIQIGLVALDQTWELVGPEGPRPKQGRLTQSQTGAVGWVELPLNCLWKTLARAVEDHACDTVAGLQDAVAEEWDKVDQQHLRNLVASMPERCAAGIAANGWHTKY